MTLKTSVEFLLMLTRANPATGTTDRWEITGEGDGQKEYAKARMQYEDAGIVLCTREVVTTDWTRKNPDPPCNGQGYAHSAHGDCEGYTYDRT